MSVASNVVKITAKTALKGNYLKAIFSSVILLFCVFVNLYLSSLFEMVFNNIIATVFGLLYSLFITFPIFIGLLRYFWRLIFEVSDNPVSVFYYFSSKSNYLKSLNFLFALIVKILPIAIIVFIPAIFVWLLSQSGLYQLLHIQIPLWSNNLEYAIIFTNTLCTVIATFISLRYYIAPILFVANDTIDIKNILKLSCVISKKSAIDFIYLCFSFLGWIVISIFAIPLIFTLPYMLTSLVVHIRFVVAEYNNHIENIKTEQFPSFTVGG